NGFASSATVISRAIIEEVAATFDMLPRNGYAEPSALAQESAARIFSSSARAELWAAGNGEHNGNGNGHANGNGNGNGHYADAHSFGRSESPENFSLVSPPPERDFAFDYSRRTDPLSSLSAPSASTSSYSFDRFSSDPLTRVSGTDPFGRG